MQGDASLATLCMVRGTLLMRYTPPRLRAPPAAYMFLILVIDLAMRPTPPFLITPAMAICWLLGLLVGGIAFLAAMGVCWLLIKGGGSDSADKHGVSTADSTRVGGALIASYVVASVVYYNLWGGSPLGDLATTALVTAFGFYCLGLLEDLRGDLKATLRFALMLGLGCMSLWMAPDYVLEPVGLGIVDGILNLNTTSQLLFTAVCIGFLPNAFNTSDGANGLLSGTALLGFLAVLTWFDSELSYLLLYAALGTLLFFLFNITTGRFFLGDGGAYFLGALMGFAIIHIANTNAVSVWCLLSLIFYPVADLLWSMGRRLVAGKSPMNPDNLHLHNLIHDVALVGWISDGARNTATGLVLVALFSGLPWLLFWQLESVTHELWFGLISVQWALYAATWFLLRLSQRS